jgi:transposase
MPIPLRADFDAQMVRSSARRSKDGPQARRLLALAAIYEGATRTQAARIGGVTLQIVRDWVLKFNAQGPEGLIDRKPPGQPSRLNDTHRAALAAIIESGPIPAVHGVVRWRVVDLCQWGFRRIPRRRRQADVEPPIARHGLSQAIGPASPLRSGRRRDRGF